MPVNSQIKYVKKVCLIGDPAVGKTSLTRRFVLDKYNDSYISTIGAKVMKKEVEMGDEEDTQVTLMIWDVMGHKHFRIIESVAFEHVKGALIICDLTRKDTLDNVFYWIEALTSISGKVPIIILANKRDLGESEFDEKDIKEVADKWNAKYFLTSAKTGENVEEAFKLLAKSCIESVDEKNE